MNTFENLRLQFQSGHLSRRDFIRQSTALGLLAAVPAGLLAEEARAAGPQKGGHMRIGSVQGSTTDSLDPATLSSGFVNLLWYTIHGQLTEVNAEGQLEPLLAESYEPDGSPDKWVFDLRKGAQFHNGKSVESGDVIASLERHKGEDSKSAMKSVAESIESMQADGPSRVIFSLKEPNADFPFALSASALSILPAKDGDVDLSGVGAGAYMVKDFEAGVRATVERNPNHYVTDKAHVDSAEILVIADSTARTNALVTGELDISGDIEAKTAHLLADRPGVVVEDTVSTQHYTFPMRTDLAPFDNPDVRMALKLAIDREEVLQKILRGRGSLGNDHPISPANRFHNADLPQRAYDPDKAKWHLKQAGMEGLALELKASDGLYAGATDTTLLFAEHAAKAGINITPVRAPDDGYWSDVWLVAPWSASYWSGRPTEDWMFTQGYSETSNWNESYWKNDRFNELLVSARGELDENKRRGMYHEMQAICRDDCGSVIHLFANHILAFRDNVKHPEKVGGNWEFDGYKIIERWWLT
ncbi:MAG: ABC transporter substrate-binding protein [Pseudomonadota bacterium]